jgi:hypothetical protein
MKILIRTGKGSTFVTNNSLLLPVLVFKSPKIETVTSAENFSEQCCLIGSQLSFHFAAVLWIRIRKDPELLPDPDP